MFIIVHQTARMQTKIYHQRKKYYNYREELEQQSETSSVNLKVFPPDTRVVVTKCGKERQKIEVTIPVKSIIHSEQVSNDMPYPIKSG